MKVSVTDLGPTQKRLHVALPGDMVREETDGRFRELAKKAHIKGFRPGKIPLSILKSYYGKAVEAETSEKLVRESFPEALRETGLKPLAEADIDRVEFPGEGGFEYEAVIEVASPFTPEGYRGIEVRRPSALVTDADVAAEVERVRQSHATLKAPDEARPVREGDVVVADLVPSVAGEVIEKGRASDQMIEVGKKALHPDFDAQIVGHASGETFAAEVEFPEDAQVKEFAGKRVRFEVSVKEIKEKIVPELNDDFAKELGRFENLAALTDAVRDQMRRRTETEAEEEVRRQIREKLLSSVAIEVSPKVVDREVDSMVGQLVRQFEMQGLKVDPARFNTLQIRGEYKPQAEGNVKWRLVLSRIAELEGMELSAAEEETIFSDLARVARKDVAAVKTEFADSPVVEEMKDSRLHEKALKFLEEEATYVSPEAKA